MKDEQTSTEPKKGVTPNHIALYAKIAAKKDKIYEVLFQLLDSRNENIKLGAAKTLLNKIVPDLKSVEVQGGINADGTRRAIEISINCGRGFVPATVSFDAPPTGSTSGSTTQIQSDGMAQTSTQDNNGDSRDSQAGTS